MLARDSSVPCRPQQAMEGFPHWVVSSQLLLSNQVHAGSINGVPTVCQEQSLALGDGVGTSHHSSLCVPDIF